MGLAYLRKHGRGYQGEIMADIDKSLPNITQTINIPSPEEMQVELEENKKDPQAPVDVQQNEDGSVDVNFDPSQVNLEQSGDHFANLAELLPDDILNKIGEPYIKSIQKNDKSLSGLGLGLFIGKTQLEKNLAKLNFRNSETRGGAEINIGWINKDLNKFFFKLLFID